MPELDILPKLKTKASLRNWFNNTLRPRLIGKAALATQMKPEMDAFEAALAELDDYDDDLPPVIDRNQNAAFLSRINQNGQNFEDYQGRIQGMIEQNVQYGKGVRRTFSRLKALVAQDVAEWDRNAEAHQRSLDSYESRNTEKHEAYHAQRQALRQRLDRMRLTFNRNYFYHGNMNEDTRAKFMGSVANAIQFVPTQHWYNPNVSSGTYFYDFRNHKFQLHIHCKPYTGKIVSVRIKIDGPGDGVGTHYKTMGEAIAGRFRVDYPPANVAFDQRVRV